MKRIVVVLWFVSSCVQEPKDPIQQVIAAAYPDGATCLSFEVEPDDIAVREIHGGECAGDPETSPISGRFRVAAGGVERYDVASDTYVLLQ
jgi:hypothetical protein